MITPASSLRPPHPEKAQISSAPLFAFPHICLFLTHKCGVVLHLFEINYVCLNFFGLEVDGRDCCLLEIQAAIKRPLRQTQQTRRLKKIRKWKSHLLQHTELMKSGGCTWRETTVTCFARRVSWSARFEEMTSSYVLDKREIMWDNAEMGHVVGGKIRPGLWHVLGAFHRTWILTTTGVGQIVVTRYFLLLRNPPHCNLPSHSENNWDNPQTSRTKIWNV